jgi:hypothetical protein
VRVKSGTTWQSAPNGRQWSSPMLASLLRRVPAGMLQGRDTGRAAVPSCGQGRAGKTGNQVWHGMGLTRLSTVLRDPVFVIAIAI